MVNWQKAVLLWFQDKVDVLEYHTQKINSANRSFNLPSVLRLKRYVNPHMHSQVKLTRQNLFLRDEFRCQYCHKIFHPRHLTIDHVLPLSRGGRHEWTNVVAACSPCNNRKSDKTVAQAGFTLFRTAFHPRWLPDKELKMRTRGIPDQWLAYLREG